MAELTIQQAYALALGAYQSVVKTAATNQNYTFSIDSAFTGETHPTLGDLTKQNRLTALLSGQAITIPLIPANGSATGTDPADDATYTLVTTANDADSDNVPDYLVGSPALFGNTGFTNEEKNYHLTGTGIFNKLKK